MTVVGSLGLFLYGMKSMSEALQRLAGSGMRHKLINMSSSTFRNVEAGTLITAILQSSGATTVMIVSFVNAGALTLAQSMAMIMGANIGTTITGWIIALLGFRFSLGIASVSLIGVGFPLLLMKRERLRASGHVLVGLALLLMGVFLLREILSGLPFPVIAGGSAMAVVLFMLAGILLSFLLQSSVATMVLTMIVCCNGWVPLECGAAMIIGENIGTTFTANLAALDTNTNARRAALFHTIFNVVGAVWALPLLFLIPRFSELFPAVADVAAPGRIAFSLAGFHTLFNLVSTFLMVWFIPQLSDLVARLIRSREGESRSATSLRYLNPALLTTGGLSMFQAQKELVEYARRSSKMFAKVRALFRETNSESFNALYEDIRLREEDNDRVRDEFYNFLTQASRGNIGAEARHGIEMLFRLVSDVEIMSDCNYSIAKLLRARKERNIWFDQPTRDKVNDMLDLIDRAIPLMNSNLAASFSKGESLDLAMEVEQSVNNLRNIFKEECLRFDGYEGGNYQSGIIFSELVTRIEQLADSIIRISEDAFDRGK